MNDDSESTVGIHNARRKWFLTFLIWCFSISIRNCCANSKFGRDTGGLSRTQVSCVPRNTCRLQSNWFSFHAKRVCEACAGVKLFLILTFVSYATNFLLWWFVGNFSCTSYGDDHMNVPVLYVGVDNENSEMLYFSFLDSRSAYS